MDFVFNELSLKPASRTVQDALDLLRRLHSTVIRAASYGIDGAILTDSELHEYMITTDHSMLDLLWQHTLEKDYSRLINSKMTKKSFEYEMFGNPNTPTQLECRFDDERAIGLTGSFILQSVALSLDKERWRKPIIPLECTEVTEEEEVNCCHSARNCCDNQTLEHHLDFIWTLLSEMPQSGDDLLEMQTRIMPNVKLGSSARERLAGVKKNDPQVAYIAKHLVALSLSAAKFENGKRFVDYLQVQNSSESQATLNMYARERTFKKANGQLHVFSFHTKITRNAWRIYYEHDPADSAVDVGYIGEHLPTVNDRH